jgi:hypothetical protein
MVNLLARLVPASAVLILFSSVFFIASGDPTRALVNGLYSWETIFLFIATITFAVITPANLVLVFLTWKRKIGPINRICFSVMAAVLCLVTLYLTYWDLIGLKAWAY